MNRVSTRLDSFISERESILRSLGPDLVPFIDFSRQFLSGGKRFRAQFALLGFGTQNAAIPDYAIDVASALEIFHAAALVHDDIMDKSDTRRGAPSAHRKFETVHGSAHWAGSSADFGTSAALLFGDLLLAFSDELIASGLLESPDKKAAHRSRKEFDRMRLDVTAGQYLDIVEERAWPSIDKLDALPRAHRVVVYKSAKYSVEAPLVIGAALAGASDQHLTTLRAFGLPLGIAFQLRDDLLGVFGDPSVTGKPAGDDLREGKRTVLIALAQRALAASDVSQMDDLLGNPRLSGGEIAHLRDMLVVSGAVDQIEALITEQVSVARSALSGSGFSVATAAELLALADGVTQRAH
ncbi:polyprenyl synthetase family protein [Alpinimonas psychrophila]|uniref:Geranylgeranyl diphosphate synthase type I n=1 Tax=Alpinimonas psychrophila TaxID=748908 RepID=A0A7W3PMZ1_9MICO|nr:geranylgeranyl diphosphate synthase type I [Alpinimonas psychrophila]